MKAGLTRFALAVSLALALGGFAWLAPAKVFASAKANVDGVAGDIRFQVADGAVGQQGVWVGQQVELQLELWTSGFSFSDQQFVLPEVKGGFLLQPDSTTVKLTESRDGVQWQGLRYSLLFYPQRQGPLEVPSFNVSFSVSAGFGTAPNRIRERTEPLRLEAQLPPGTGSAALLVTTTSFSMSSGWSPHDPSDGTVELKVGDALTLTVKRVAEDVPGMVFAPLPELVIDGLGVYPAAPEVKDRVNRGRLVGERSDSVTFVCQVEGDFRIPSFSFDWWDPQREELSELVIDELQLTVAANPGWGEAGSVKSGRHVVTVENVLLAAVLSLAMALAWFFLLPAVRILLEKRRQTRELTEGWAFQQVKKACRSNHPADAYNAITLWLNRSELPARVTTLSELAQWRKDEALKKEATTLQESVASGLAEGWRGAQLFRLLEQSREGLEKSPEKARVLRALNPPPIR